MDVPLPEKTLWRMLYETAAWASEILALDIDDLDLPGWRAKVTSKEARLSGCTVLRRPPISCPG